MWILYAAGSAFFAGITAILAKCGIKKTDSNVATAIRTVVVLAFSWLMVGVTGAGGEIGRIDPKTLLFLVLSGLATGASWLCYFRALSLGDINRVVPIDKSSTVMTIVLALIFLREGITWGKAAGAAMIGAGTLMMIGKKEERAKERKGAAGCSTRFCPRFSQASPPFWERWGSRAWIPTWEPPSGPELS